MADNINVFKLYKEKDCSTITHACSPKGRTNDKCERRHAFEETRKLSARCQFWNVFIFKILLFVSTKIFLLTSWNKNGVLYWISMKRLRWGRRRQFQYIFQLSSQPFITQ